ncbi:MAG: Ig-like domain-containing protein [Armatimonadia bacterium]
MFQRGFLTCLLCGTIVLVATVAFAGPVIRVSVSTGATQGNNGSGRSQAPDVSEDGRYIVFESDASNLVAGDTNGVKDIFVRDCVTRQTTRVSVATGGVQANAASDDGGISADGRYVAFGSRATNLVPGDINGVNDIFVHDRVTGQTKIVSVATGGTQADNYSEDPSLSTDGRHVVFHSFATNLVANDTNRFGDIFVHDRVTGETTRVSVATGGEQGNGESGDTSGISGDGRYVAFYSCASNLVSGDTNETSDVFVRDRVAGLTTRVSLATNGTQANDSCFGPSISADGQFIAFSSWASNLVPGDTNGIDDIFVWGRISGETTRASVATGGAQSGGQCHGASLSADGRYVAFATWGNNLVPGDTDDAHDVFVRDRVAGTTTLISAPLFGVDGICDMSLLPSISANGRHVAFVSDASNLIVGDTNGVRDVFVRDMTNTRPTTPTTVTIAPTAPGPETLTVTASGSTDADGDSLTYKCQWAKKKADGTWDAWGYTGNELAASIVKIGDTWRVRAQAYDGASYSPWKIGSSVTVVNMAGVTPAPKTYNVPVTSCVFVSFRWPVQQATVTTRVQIKLGTTKVVPATMTWVTAERKVKLRPRVPLLPNTYYRVNLDTGITCTSGRVLGWGENYWFKTAPAAVSAAVSVAAAPTAGGAQVSVNLSSAATVRTVICNIAGRVVAELAERELPAGVSSLVWNGRGTSGTKVPAGCYLVRVEAKGGEGAVASAMVPLQVR